MNQAANRTLPVGHWQAAGLCRIHCHGTDLFFPDGETSPAAIRQINEAKSICRACLVIADCQEWALANREEHGVWGGLSEADRRNIHRRAARNGSTLTAAAATPRVRYTTITEALTARSVVEDGHRLWKGSRYFTIDGIRYTASRTAFEELYGRPPVGQVNSYCGQPACIAHLDDQEIRGQCGTPGGYRKHHAQGKEPCRPCKNANADADRRLRNTGTSKQLAAV